MKKLSTAFILSLVSASFAWAGPLREADLGADAKWFAHVDVDAIRATPAGQQFLAERANTSHNPFAKFETETGFNVTSSLDGVTCYGNGQPDQRVIVIRHHFENEKLESWLKTRNYETGKINDVTTAYFLPIKLKQNVEGKIIVVFPKNGVILMGVQSGSLDHAMARLDDNNTAAAIPEQYRQLGVAVPAISGAVDIDACRTMNPGLIPALNTKIVAFAAGIVNFNIEGESRSEMSSPEAAQGAVNIIQGYCNSHAEAVPFLKSVTAVASGDQVQVKGALPVDTIIQKIRKLKEHCHKAEDVGQEIEK